MASSLSCSSSLLHWICSFDVQVQSNACIAGGRVMTWPVLLLSAMVLTFSLFVLGQPPAPAKSPDVQPDGHVTFRFHSPNAQKVSVTIEGQRDPVAMQKDDQGVWSATVGPMPPDIYGYSIVADGVSLIDPS